MARKREKRLDTLCAEILRAIPSYSYEIIVFDRNHVNGTEEIKINV